MTPGLGPAQCGDGALHGHTALAFPRPQRKGLLRSESGAKWNTKWEINELKNCEGENLSWVIHVKM